MNLIYGYLNQPDISVCIDLYKPVQTHKDDAESGTSHKEIKPRGRIWEVTERKRVVYGT